MATRFLRGTLSVNYNVRPCKVAMEVVHCSGGLRNHLKQVVRGGTLFMGDVSQDTRVATHVVFTCLTNIDVDFFFQEIAVVYFVKSSSCDLV